MFVVLDISGSMDNTCNKLVNNGIGYFATVAAGVPLLFFPPTTPLGGIILASGISTTKAINMNSSTRLDEAKKHLINQIIDLIKKKRINKLGLITFNHEARIC